MVYLLLASKTPRLGASETSKMFKKLNLKLDIDFQRRGLHYWIEIQNEIYIIKICEMVGHAESKKICRIYTLGWQLQWLHYLETLTMRFTNFYLFSLKRSTTSFEIFPTFKCTAINKFNPPRWQHMTPFICSRKVVWFIALQPCVTIYWSMLLKWCNSINTAQNDKKNNVIFFFLDVIASLGVFR